MNNNSIKCYECLCSDLGMRLRNTTVSEAAIGAVRKDFLLWLENEDDSSLFATWAVAFDEIYASTHTLVIRNVLLERGPCDWYSWQATLSAAVSDVYQVLSFPLKIEVTSTTTTQENEYIRKFLENEEETGKFKVDRNSDLLRLTRSIVRRTLQNCDLSANALRGRGRHGPGAVYGREVGTDKNYLHSPPLDLLKQYGWETFFANADYLYEYNRASNYDRSERHVVARLALVPKDYRGPRGVFISPKEAVFCQLGQESILREALSRTWVRHCFNPTSQAPSQEVAWLGSIDKSWATLDLKDASDRVPLPLMAYLLHREDYLALARTRPSFVELPGHPGRHKLRMFAPMGDGKTFPVLSFLCCCASMSAIWLARGGTAARPPSLRELGALARGNLRVFGDDVATRPQYYSAVCGSLEAHNLKVNVGKSFYKGFFRESCGLDAYRGRVVTPLRLRCELDPTTDPIKLIEFHNRMVTKFAHLKRTIAHVRSYIESTWGIVGYTSRSDMCPTCLQVSAAEIATMVKAYPWRHKDSRTDLTTSLSCEISSALFMQDFDIQVAALQVVRQSSRQLIRWNTDKQCFEQYVLGPHRGLRLDAGEDPWWDLNYWLITHHHKHEESTSPWRSNTTPIVSGSMMNTARLNTLRELLAISPIRIKPETVTLAWVQLI